MTSVEQEHLHTPDVLGIHKDVLADTPRFIKKIELSELWKN
jgi:hypothetical protein